MIKIKRMQDALAPILISHLFQQGLLVFVHSFFIPGVFLFRFCFFFEITIYISKKVYIVLSAYSVWLVVLLLNDKFCSYLLCTL